MTIICKDIFIDNLPRLTKFPYQVKSIGYTQNGVYSKRSFYQSGRLEVCIRLFAKEPEAIDYIDSVEYRTNYPHVILKIPGAHHQFTADDSRETFHFTYPDHLVPTLRDILSFPEKPIWEITIGEQESKLIAELTNLMECSQGHGESDRIDIIAFQLFEQVIFQYNSSISPPSSNEIKIRNIASYFQLNFRDDIDIESLVSRYGMSRSTFVRHWRQFYQETPGRFVLNLKLDEACRILREDLSINVRDLSCKLNFQDSAYFGALFKKHYNMTPLQYRRKMAKSQHHE